jgi:hypothetical protein
MISKLVAEELRHHARDVDELARIIAARDHRQEHRASSVMRVITVEELRRRLAGRMPGT